MFVPFVTCCTVWRCNSAAATLPSNFGASWRVGHHPFYSNAPLDCQASALTIEIFISNDNIFRIIFYINYGNPYINTTCMFFFFIYFWPLIWKACAIPYITSVENVLEFERNSKEFSFDWAFLIGRFIDSRNSWGMFAVRQRPPFPSTVVELTVGLTMIYWHCTIECHGTCSYTYCKPSCIVHANMYYAPKKLIGTRNKISVDHTKRLITRNKSLLWQTTKNMVEHLNELVKPIECHTCFSVIAARLVPP